MTPHALFLDGAPPRQPAHRVEKAGRYRRLVERGRIERGHRHLVAAARIMGINVDQAVRLVIEIMAAVGNDMIFMLVRS